MPRMQGTSRKGKPGKKDRQAGMGRALQKAQGQRYRPKANGRAQDGTKGMSMQAGVETIGVETDEAQKKTTMSVLEVNDLDDFLHQAAMAGREFESEKQGVVVLDAAGQLYRGPSTVTFEDDKPRRSDFSFTELSVPRRPAWDASTTAEELQQREQAAFLDWRRGIAAQEQALIHDNHNAAAADIAVTPFEKNLQVWRQLWRVLERSSCVLQLVDARNPLFYLSHDLKQYCSDELNKPMMVLVNKSDYLSATQRRAWKDYLQHQQNWEEVIFFSAHAEQAKLDQAAQDERKRLQQQQASLQRDFEAETKTKAELTKSDPADDNVHDSDALDDDDDDDGGVAVPLTRRQLLRAMQQFAQRHHCQADPKYDHDRLQFGMVGFPNVGKSSVINVLMGNSKHSHHLTRVGVAAQPGKTKHFQTLLVPDAEHVMLCDCPGLVFPSFVSNTADLIAAGVYPIAQMRDWRPVVHLICQRLSRALLQAHYGIRLPTAAPWRQAGLTEQPPPTADEFLTALCEARGLWAAASGVPDYTRGVRLVVTDYAAGKLLYCHAPPPSSFAADDDDDDAAAFLARFHQETVKTALERTAKLKAKLQQQQQQQQQQLAVNGDAAKDADQAEKATNAKGEGAEPLANDVEAQNEEAEEEDNNDDDSEEEDDDSEEEADKGAANNRGTMTHDDDDDDELLLEFLDGGADGGRGGKAAAVAVPGAPSKRSKRRANRKNKRRPGGDDPYGCHATPDDFNVVMGNHQQQAIRGVTVMGKQKKHGNNKGFTRRTGYGFPGAMPTQATTS